MDLQNSRTTFNLPEVVNMFDVMKTEVLEKYPNVRYSLGFFWWFKVWGAPQSEHNVTRGIRIEDTYEDMYIQKFVVVHFKGTEYFLKFGTL